jgi:DNA polymerase-3 subunit alpha
MDFTHLHCHTHFSLLDGLSKIDPLVERALELKMNALAMTDHGVMYGAIEFYNRCLEANIKPIVGLEAYVAPRSRLDKEGRSDSDYFHLTLLSQNWEGYHHLIELTTQAHLEGFYYKPRIDLEILKAKSSGLIALSGCQRGEIARALMRSQKEGQEALEKYLAIFGRENFYIEVQRNSRNKDAQETELNARLVDLAKKNSLKLVATADCHYIYPEDAEAQDVLVCIGTARTVTDTDRLDMRGYDLSLKSAEQMAEKFYDIPEALDTTQEIANKCQLEIKTNQHYFPKVKIPEGQTSEEFLRQTVYEKALPLYGRDGALPEEIKIRLDYELNIIIKKGFDTYFLMVADIVQGAHNIGAITNTRGSAAGSLVGKVLGITNVDPLYYELPFERFLTEHRPTPPDIDLDIADNRRDEAIAYITEHYGKEKVAQIITFGTMKARAAVRDVGRALGVSYSKCDRIAKMIPLGKQGFDMTIDTALAMSRELKEAFDQDPETRQIIEVAKKIEGNARHASVHAAGIVITPTELTDYLPLQKEPEGERIITQYDMYALDVNANGKAIGVIKMDLLGIRNLSILESAVSLVKKLRGKEIDIYNLPHPDPKTFKLLSEGYTFGVFQMGSSGMTRYLKELKPSSIFDIMAMIALYRPGPLQFIPEYIRRKHNPALIQYLDPALEKILHRTYGILVYQDDLLTIAHDLAGYTWEEVDKFRKAVGKKIPEEMAKQKIKFIEGCMKTAGWSQAKAAEIWAWIEPFAAYGFNKSHSALYAVVSYQTAYMKANFPVEFMAAVMTAESGDETKIYEAVEECKSLNIQVLPPDVSESYGDFTVVDDNTIRFGLNAIKNLGSDVVERIIEARKTLQAHKPFESLEDFLIKCHVKNFNKKSWEALCKAGALDAFGERGQLLANTEEVLDFVREHFKAENSGQNSLFGKSLQVGKLKIREVAPATDEEKLLWEKEHLGMFVSSHPLDNFKKVLDTMPKIKDLRLDASGNVTLGGMISRLKRTLTKKNDPMAFFTLEDQTGKLEVLVFPKAMQQALPYLKDDQTVQVSGRLSGATARGNRQNGLEEEEGRYDEELKIIADEIKPLPNDTLYELALGEMEKSKHLSIFVKNLNDKAGLNRIKEILQGRPGNAEVYLNVGLPPKLTKIKTQSKVRINQDLVNELKTVVSVSKVDVE